MVLNFNGAGKLTFFESSSAGSATLKASRGLPSGDIRFDANKGRG